MSFPIACFVSATLLLSVPVFAEGKPQEDWAEQAALGYEKKAAEAEQKGDATAAKIYLRMAQIKRDAGAASKNGQEFSWDEYHRLNGELQGKTQEQASKDKPKAGPGDGFMKAAEEYHQLGLAAIKAADANKANIYLELAQIKREAARAAVEGKDFDWTRYQDLKGRLAK
jgi:hypothetical protein